MLCQIEFILYWHRSTSHREAERAYTHERKSHTGSGDRWHSQGQGKEEEKKEKKKTTLIALLHVIVTPMCAMRLRWPTACVRAGACVSNSRQLIKTSVTHKYTHARACTRSVVWGEAVCQESDEQSRTKTNRSCRGLLRGVQTHTNTHTLTNDMIWHPTAHNTVYSSRLTLAIILTATQSSYLPCPCLFDLLHVYVFPLPPCLFALRLVLLKPQPALGSFSLQFTP